MLVAEEAGGKDAYSNTMGRSYNGDCGNEKDRTAQLGIPDICGYDSGAGYDFSISFIRGASQIENSSNFALAPSQSCFRIK